MNENPVMGPIARVELGKPGPSIGKTRYSAIKRAMGLTGRYVFISQIQRWLKDHPNFSEREVYPRVRKSRRSIRSDPRALTARKNGEP